MFFQLKESTKTDHDTYHKAFQLVKALIHHECPEHRANHHILYSANQKLEAYLEAQKHFRQFEDPATVLGTFSTEAYQVATKKYHQLYFIIRGYMHLSDESRRDHFNHHFRFHAEKLNTMYLLWEQKNYWQLLNLDISFYEQLKEDLVPLLTQFE
ncbi:hypothetical protein CSE16_05115 [Solibacillus sp. R5-41]|uniref:hypothetical protein n=1 Tax=Solibacillus sp. R5-41 TaxID=2048654 RepID=UPI000C1290AF|nr:hypothetical protein [Solibacillus sp. R5-41]ATP39478.1 hypothetical protein CSE16_05115 [Solibacillus sp. R5-41]